MNNYLILAVVIAMIAFVYMKRESFSAPSCASHLLLYNLATGKNTICRPNDGQRYVNINNTLKKIDLKAKCIMIMPTSSINLTPQTGEVLTRNVIIDNFIVPQDFVILPVYYNLTKVTKGSSTNTSSNSRYDIYSMNFLPQIPSTSRPPTSLPSTSRDRDYRPPTSGPLTSGPPSRPPTYRPLTSGPPSRPPTY